MELLNLAYPLSQSTPFYEHLAGPRVERLFSLEKGDDCNSYYLTTSKHAGTHVDATRHFDAQGRKIAEHSLEELDFRRPAVVDLSIGLDELITGPVVRSLPIDSPNCDILHAVALERFLLDLHAQAGAGWDRQAPVGVQP